MASFKIVVSDPSSGKSEVLEAKDSQALILHGPEDRRDNRP